MFAWIVLVISGVFEAVWATALGYSDGLRKLWPSVIFVVALVISMGGLAWAVKTIPAATGYVVWTAVGASLAVIYAMATGREPASVLRVALIIVIVAAVVGLKLLTPTSSE